MGTAPIESTQKSTKAFDILDLRVLTDSLKMLHCGFSTLAANDFSQELHTKLEQACFGGTEGEARNYGKI